MERARNLAVQKPWIGLLVAAPVCLALLGTAFYQYRKARAFGDEPQRLSVAAALVRVSSGNEPWVELADARFECTASVALGGSRYGRLRVDDRPVTVIAGFSGSDCPESGEPLVGVLAPLGERLMANLRNRGLADVTGADAVLFTYAGPSNSNTGAVVLSVLALCCGSLGFIGYIIRYSQRRLERLATPEQRRAVLLALERPPLTLRPRYVAGQLLTALMLAVMQVGMLLGAVWLVARIFEIRGERGRFDEAREVTTVAAPAIDSEGGLLLLPQLWPTVTVSWPSPHDHQRTESVEYHPLWAAAVRQPITVRTDAAGVITSAGLDLEGWRCALWGLALAMALFTTPVLARGLARMARRWRTLQRALRQPRLEFLPITRLDVQKQSAIPVGVRCEVRDESGRLHSSFFSSDRPPLKDESGAKVLAVTPRGEPLAEPVLVADDGYPFVIG